ncbi:GL14360 [Drosophila persimilis]|uniref:GL14360 n=1 Tax=Drosophila persimilis TaxID=7234 RepID=B4GTI4_DROPE|nr:delta-sarcoglycan isoform X1 [Drosophila persimilis]EDW25854.1 GL14360 [Drosophila persimilis]
MSGDGSVETTTRHLKVCSGSGEGSRQQQQQQPKRQKRLSTGTTPKKPSKAGNNLGLMTAGNSRASGSGSGSGIGAANIQSASKVGTMTTVTATPGKATLSHVHSHSHSHGHGRGHGHGHGRGGRSGRGGAVTGAGAGGGPRTAGQCNVDGFAGGIETYLGLIGWRKKCLYTLLLLLMLLIVTNLVLTLWIIKVMQFSLEGMGQLKILPGGIQLSGTAIIMDMLRTSTIRSRPGHPISIESSRNFSINTRDANGMIENHLFLGHDKFECLAATFRINDTNGRNLFSVNRKEVTVGAHSLRIDGEGGAVFRASVQTPHVRAEPGRELRLESPTRQLKMAAAKDINLQSRAGAIDLVALNDVKLRSLDGSVRLESSKILMPNLRTAQPPIMGSAQSREHMHRVFQLCACSNGKLFLAAPHSICAGDDSTVCR